jgi:hypothetical protein
MILGLALMAGTSGLRGQIVGESETTSISLRKPAEGAGKEGPGDRNLNDVSPPRITIISPLLDTAATCYLAQKDIFLIGRVTDESPLQSLRINDSLTGLDENGFFQRIIRLETGLNVMEIQALDAHSNAITELVKLIYAPGGEIREEADEIITAGAYYGLIIGVDEYEDPGLVDLDHPVTDATMLYSTLIGNYLFETENITLLKNPTRAEIILKFDELSQRLTRKDNLVIFYAGHGYWDENRETGFWLPSDADRFSSVNWIRNSTIQDYIGDIQTNHTLLISDACFAGSIFKTRGAFNDASIAVNKLYSLSSRKAMTSGTFEEVPDRSVFLEFLLKRLNENSKKYISAGELFSSFREAVLNNSPNIPQYGVIQDTGDEGGDFIFVRQWRPR